jgi:DNA polymerase iota
VIIELGEDISRFRDASKELYGFVKEYTWNGRVERLGFDEVCEQYANGRRMSGG